MILLLLACGPRSSTPVPSPPGPVAERWLFVGNSYLLVEDTPGRVQRLAEQLGLDRETVMVATPGYTLAEHAGDAVADGTRLRDLLSEDWDRIVAQEQSQLRGLGPATLQGSLDAVRSLEEAAGQTVSLMQTWGRRDGDPSNPTLFADYLTMQDRLDEGFAAHPGPLVPVGDAYRSVHALDQEVFASLYQADGSHPSPIGAWLAAAVVLQRFDGELPSAPAGADPAVVTVLEQALASLR